MTCAACSGSLKSTTIQGRISGRQITVQVCRKCGGLHFSGYKGDAYDVVNIATLQAEAKVPGSDVYFDFDLLGSKGLERVHGWFDPATRTAVQFG